jgi:hypothetical protein
MKKMGMYCKAYTLSQLRQFSGWSESPQNPETKHASADDDLVYVQENYVVTQEIFIDENIIFNNITPEWQDFCQGVLKFDPVQDS